MSRGLHVAALMWGVPGFAVQMYGLYAGQPLLAAGGAVLLVAGLMFCSRAKGYAPVWGLWGLVPVMGPIILVLQPHRAGTTPEETIDRLLIEEDPRIHATRRHEADTMSGGWPLLATMTPVGILIMLLCGGLPKALAPSVEPVVVEATVPTPVAPPVPEPAPITPAVPAVAPKPVAPPAPVPPRPKTSEEKYAEIKPGMTYEQVCAIMGHDTTLISGKVGMDSIIKWRNADKSYFAVRFRAGRLDRVTSLMQPPVEKRNEEIRTELEPRPASGGTPSPVRGRAPAALPGLTEAEAAVEGRPPTAQPTEEPPIPEDTDAVEESTARTRVVRIGERANTTGRVRKARLPKYTQTLGHGPHDVHIVNPSQSGARVGIRMAGKRGKDLFVSPESDATVYLDNGQYTVYYIDMDAPENLNNAGSFTVDSPPDAIVVVLR